MKKVLQKLREHHLYLKLEKCEFHRNSIQFLGYVIDHHDIHMDQRKVQVVKEWPQPSTIKELKQFLCFANFYRRFISNFSLKSVHKASDTNHISQSESSVYMYPKHCNQIHIFLNIYITNIPKFSSCALRQLPHSEMMV